MKIVDTKKRASKAEFVNGVRLNRTGRRTFTDDYKVAIVRQCRERGASVAAIAMAHRINANLVRRWIVRYRRTLPSPAAKPPATLLPVTIDAACLPAKVLAEEDADAAAKRRGASSATIEIEFCGARIRLRGGVDVQSLRSVLDVLAQR